MRSLSVIFVVLFTSEVVMGGPSSRPTSQPTSLPASQPTTQPAYRIPAKELGDAIKAGEVIKGMTLLQVKLSMKSSRGQLVEPEGQPEITKHPIDRSLRYYKWNFGHAVSRMPRNAVHGGVAVSPYVHEQSGIKVDKTISVTMQNGKVIAVDVVEYSDSEKTTIWSNKPLNTESGGSGPPPRPGPSGPPLRGPSRPRGSRR